MRIFVSWSGSAGRKVAESLRLLLPQMLAGRVELFVSSQDIEKGERGLSIIAGELENIDYGLVLLSKESLASKWINFEAGALGRSLTAGKVSPLLLDLTPADVTGPLAQFQMTSLTDHDDVLRLIRDINNALPEPVPDPAMVVLFDNYWGELSSAIEVASDGKREFKTSRSNTDLLEEILSRVRGIEVDISADVRRSVPVSRQRTENAMRVAFLFEDLIGYPVEVRDCGRHLHVKRSDGLPIGQIDRARVRRTMDDPDVRIVWEGEPLLRESSPKAVRSRSGSDSAEREARVSATGRVGSRHVGATIRDVEGAGD